PRPRARSPRRLRQLLPPTSPRAIENSATATLPPPPASAQNHTPTNPSPISTKKTPSQTPASSAFPPSPPSHSNILPLPDNSPSAPSYVMIVHPTTPTLLLFPVQSPRQPASSSPPLLD